MKLTEFLKDKNGDLSSTRLMRVIYGLTGIGFAFFKTCRGDLTMYDIILILGWCGMSEAVNVLNKKIEGI